MCLSSCSRRRLKTRQPLLLRQLFKTVFKARTLGGHQHFSQTIGHNICIVTHLWAATLEGTPSFFISILVRCQGDNNSMYLFKNSTL